MGFLHHIARRVKDRKSLIEPLRLKDLALLPISATFYACRLWIASEEQLAHRLFRKAETAPAT
jgi:hypothetical protein